MTREMELYVNATPSISSRDRFVEILEALVSHESPTHEVAHCNRLADHLAEWAARQGAEVSSEAPQGRGQHVIARWPGAGPSTLVAMHYDTVWPLNTVEARPFVVEGDIARGPGVLDMKGGIALFMLAMEKIRADARELDGSVTALFTSDEEDGSVTSEQLIRTEAGRHDRCFCMEPGADPFSLRMERKGVRTYVASFAGIPAHAGNAPQTGASALLEMARFLLFTEGLNNFEQGVTVTAGVARGGSVVNVVPAEAEVALDTRVWTEIQAAELDSALRSYTPHDDRVEWELDAGAARPPLEFNERNRELFEFVSAKATEIGLSLGRVAVGGGSDGSITSAVGCATVDGMGACGAGPHEVGEHIRISDSLRKGELLLHLLTR